MRYALGLLIAAIVVFSAQATFACKCAPPPAPKKALARATAVFMGKVVDIDRSGGHRVKVTFTVDTSYKGVSTKKVVVQTGRGGGDCGIRFTKGEIYVVYCHGKDKVLSTGSCSRTRPASRAKEDIDALGEGTAVE